jgi:urease accessory protein
MNSAQLLSLLQLSDPTLPIGGFSHSAGLETYVQYGIVKDKNSAGDFIRAQLAENISYTDAAFVSLAFDAAEAGNAKAVQQLDEECHAVKLPREMRQMSQKLGLRLLKIFSPLCENAFAAAYKKTIENGEANGHYPLVFGIYAAAMKMAKKEALTAFFYNAAAGMVTNSVKLVPLGQLDGQAILFSLHPLIEKLVNGAMSPDRNKIGLCCTGFDIRCMQHEQLYSRLYMS